MAVIDKKNRFLALTNVNFRKLLFCKFLMVSAIIIQEVSISYYIYIQTRNPLSLGLIGLAEAIPFIALVLIGGYSADRCSKKKTMTKFFWVLLLTSTSLLISNLEMFADLIPQYLKLLLCYCAIFIYGSCRAFISPAIDALRIFVLDRNQFDNAATWWSTAWQSGSIISPGIAGIVLGAFGFSASLSITVFLLLFALLISYRIVEPEASSMPQLKSKDFLGDIKQGLSYVFKTKIIFYAISLDLFSVLFGGVVAILPIYAEEILQVGPKGFGLLRMAPSIGAVIALGIMIFYSPNNKPWRNLLLAVSGFGVFILIFGVSETMWISLLALFLAGASDSVSVVIRFNILQVMAPEGMRGRVHSINSIFLSSSNEIGAFESGVMAKLLGTVQSVVFGGLACLGVVGLIFWKSKDLFSMRFDDDGDKNTKNLAQ